MLRETISLRGRNAKRTYQKEKNAATDNGDRVLFMEGIEFGPDCFISCAVADQLNMLLSRGGI